MPRIKDIEWSPLDTKAILIKKARKVGLDATHSMLKAEIVSMMMSASEKEAVKRQPPPLSPTPSRIIIPPKVYTDPDESTFPAPPPYVEAVITKATMVPSVLDYIIAIGGRVPYEKIIKSCGPNAQKDVKRLLKEGKVVQYKNRSKFYFEAKPQ
jgi:hypothetical protein